MKRAPSEDLFRLIRSLSKGEKRNFKLLAGLLAGEKDKKYIELFDVIDRQDTYDEGRVLRQTKDLYGGQLAVGKHYLFKLILKSLVYYRNNPGADLNNYLEQVKVLAEKDLYPQAHKFLRKGLQEARVIEDFSAHYTLLRMQLDMVLRTQNEKNLAQSIKEIEAESTEVIAKMVNLDAFKGLNNRAFLLTQTRSVASGEVDRAALDALQQHDLMADIAEAHSVRARIEFHILNRKFSSLKGNLEEAILHSERLLALFDENPVLKEELIRLYFAELANVCTYLLRLGRIPDAFAKMDEFRQFRLTYPKARVDFFQLYYVMLIAAAVHTGQPERALALEMEMEEEWTAVEGKIPKAHEMWLRYLLAYAHFMSDKHKTALRWVNKLLAEPRSDLRIDIQANARLLNLMIHYNLGNYTVVESEVVSAKRFMEKYDQLQEYEKQALRCLKALAIAANGPNAKSVTASWHAKLFNLETQSTSPATRMLDIVEWLHGMVAQRSMADLRKANTSQGYRAAFPEPLV